MKPLTSRWAWVVSGVLTLIPNGAWAADGRFTGQRPDATPRVSDSNVEIVDGTPIARPMAARPAGTAGRGLPESARDVAGDPAAAGLSTITYEAGMASPLGGDDVYIGTSTLIGTGSSKPRLQVAADGTLFIAFQIVTPTFSIEVYKSTDDGDNWTHWSTFAPAYIRGFGDFHLAEGDVDRLFIAYRGSLFDTIHIAYADPWAAVPSWAVVDVFDGGGTLLSDNVSLDTDAWEFTAYFVYVALEVNDSDGSDIWFARSTNQGTSFTPAYRIAEETDDSWGYTEPTVSVGFGAYVHVAYLRGLTPKRVYHRRASNFASAAWDVQQELGPGGGYEVDAFAASPIDGTVILHEDASTPRRHYSTDYGLTWNHTPVFNNRRALHDGIAFLAGKFVVAAGAQGLDGWEISILRSDNATPGTVDLVERISVHESDFISPAGGGVVLDPTHANRIGVVWERSVDFAGIREIRFDAEWRRDAGYANTEIGFPTVIAGGGQTPPAIAEVDGDFEKEIVFGTIAGDIHVVNHDGSYPTGWPVNIGSMPFDVPVAVGDLVGNDEFTVVAGTATGWVHALDASGTPLPGWPVDLGTGAPVYVSIGALGPPNARYVVALSFRNVAILDYTGTNVAPAYAPIPFGTYSRPAAIGDVNNDGVTDIVSVAGQNIYFHQKDDALYQGVGYPGEVFSDAPTLADIEDDGDLEIAAPTASGKMYLLDYDTGLVAGWPITVSPGVALTSAAMAQILGTGALELVFARANGGVHVRYATGVEQSGYPQSIATPVFMPPIVYPVNVSGSNVNIGSTNAIAHSWRNVPSNAVPGWPRNLPGPVEETFAAGDIDGDGRSEIVALGVEYLTVFDIGTPPPTNVRTFWPMYGYDAQRTGCMCEETLTAADDAPGALYTARLAVYPNPFNPATTIEYDVAAPGPVRLAIYDVAGREVDVLIANPHHAAGRHSLRYETNLASGVYFARLTQLDRDAVQKLVILK